MPDVNGARVYRYSYPLALPILGLVVDNVNNPVLIGTSISMNISVKLSVSMSEKKCSCLAGDQFSEERATLWLRNFVSRLEEYLGLSIPFSIRCSIDIPIRMPSLYIYAVCSNSIIKMLSGISDVVAEEYQYLLQSAILVDVSLGFNPSLLGGYRYAIELGKSLVYHYGEGVYVLNNVTIELENPKQIVRLGKQASKIPPRIMSLIVKLIGYSVLELVQYLEEGEIDHAQFYYRLENSILHVLYGIKVPEEGYPWRWVYDNDYAYLYPIKIKVGDRYVAGP